MLAQAQALLDGLGTPEGGLASALDADTNGVEGATYAWEKMYFSVSRPSSVLKISVRTRSLAASTEGEPIGSMVRMLSPSAMTNASLRRRQPGGRSNSNVKTSSRVSLPLLT